MNHKRLTIAAICIALLALISCAAAMSMQNPAITISWTATDPLNQGFIITRNGVLLAQVPASAMSYTDSTAATGITYQYGVTTVSGVVVTFTTSIGINNPPIPPNPPPPGPPPPNPPTPTTPINPNPPTGSVTQTSLTLSCGGGVNATTWTIIGPDLTNPPTTVHSNLSQCALSVSGLQNSDGYFWIAVANNSTASVSGQTWSFTTSAPSAPPSAPNNPNPSNGGTSVIAPTLSCGGGVGATSWIITGPDLVNPPVTVHNVSTCSYISITLSNSSTYFWTVTAVSSNGSTPSPVWTFTTPSAGPPPSGEGTLLQQSNIKTCTVLLSPFVGTGPATTFYPMDEYYRGAQKYYIGITGDGHLYDFPATGAVPCTTPLSSIPHAPYGNDYGLISGLASSSGQLPELTSNAMYGGVHVDTVTGQVIVSVVSIYTTPYVSNNFFGFIINTSNATKTLNWCAGLNGVPIAVSGGGAVEAPPWFVSGFLSAGIRMLFGSGGPNAGGAGNFNLGMYGAANAVPAANACAANTDYLIGPGNVLVKHPGNNTGPTCANSVPGCTPTGVPNSPYPQRLALNGHSSGGPYAEDWVESGGYGYVGPIIGGATYNWLKSANGFEGLLSTYGIIKGWINTTVTASTYNGATNSGTMTLASIDYHLGGGVPPDPGTVLWVESCVVGTDTNCATVNLNNASCAIVDSVAGSVVTFHYGQPCLTDPSSSSHTPIVGGFVYGGAQYAHGEPGPSNQIGGLQIIDPIQFGQVITAGKDPSTVTYNSDFSLASYMPQFTNTDGTFTYVGYNLGQPMIDNANNAFTIPLKNAATQIGTNSMALFTFTVGP